MKFLYGIVSLLLLISCGQSTNNQTEKTRSSVNTVTLADSKEETVPFLWRDSSENIVINDSLCAKLSDPQKAALGYVATFVGSDCDWDGDYDDNRTNLKCKILTALDLGYQCSEKHLGFLRQWFRGDTVSLHKLEGCPTVPYTATIQETFVEINLTTKGNAIAVYFEGNGVNLREQQNWSWTETDYFLVEGDRIKLAKQDKSDLDMHQFGEDPST